MSLELLPDGWMRFAGGRRWRVRGPRYLCEVESDGHTPSYRSLPAAVARVRRVQMFYSRRPPSFGPLDRLGTGLDIVVANACAESLGTVPSPIDLRDMEAAWGSATGIDPGARLDHLVRYVSTHGRYLERREPGYTTPLATPQRVSVGAHHCLVSTALELQRGDERDESREGRIRDLLMRLPSESLVAVDYAIRYFNRASRLHQQQPPLLAATYNAGSPRLDTRNPWHLRQYGEHVDRWVAYYNTARLLGAAA